MKNFYSLLSLLYLFSAHAMQKEPRPIIKKNKADEFIAIKNHDVEYYTGNNLRYYNEYHGEIEDSWVLFPKRCCDPLNLYCANNVYYFFTSAIEGRQPVDGRAIQVLDETIDKLFVVRAKAGNGHWAQVYCGINSKRFNTDDDNQKFYTAKILAIQHKDTKHIENRSIAVLEGAKALDAITIHKNLSEWTYKEGPNPAQTLKKTLIHGILQDGIGYKGSSLYSTICYWTQKENRLKGISYGQK